MRFILLTIFTFGTGVLLGQIKPEIFPEDMGIDEIQTRCYCKPGVRNKSRSKGLELSYSYLGPGRYKEETSPINGRETTFQNVQNFKINAKIPVIRKDNFKFIIGYKYFAEHYNYNIIGDDFEGTLAQFEQETLRNNSLSLIVSRPLDETKYLAFRVGYAANGNYERFLSLENDYSIYKLTGFYGVKPNDDLEWGFGLNVSQSFRRFSVLPFFMYNRTYNSRWGIEAILPAYAFARYNIAHRYIFLMGFEYSSKSYRLRYANPIINGVDDFAYNHSELIASIELEHRFLPWFWGNIKMGYNLNFSSQFEGKNPTTESFDFDPSNNVYLHIGLFLSPPDKF